MILNPNPTVESVLRPTLYTFYDIFNREYFGGRLRRATIVVGTTRPHILGEYRRGGHHITITDRHMTDSLQAVLETLVHEMAHAWQFAYGTPGENNYHNAEFQACLARIGIKSSELGVDSATGEPFVSFLQRCGVDAHPN
jgi:hypothetical protein